MWSRAKCTRTWGRWLALGALGAGSGCDGGKEGTGTIVAFSARDGKKLWSSGIIGTPTRATLLEGEPALVQVDSYSPCWGGGSHASYFNLRTGQAIARNVAVDSGFTQAEDTCAETPIARATGVAELCVVQSIDGLGFVAFDRATGERRWAVTSGFFRTVGGSLFQVRDGSVALLSNATGNALWVVSGLGEPFAAFENELLFGESTFTAVDTLAAVDFATGTVRWQLPVASLQSNGLVKDVVVLGERRTSSQCSSD